MTPNIVTPNIVTPNIVAPNMVTPNGVTSNVVTPNGVIQRLWHPDWCGLQYCTAYAPEDVIERTYHRSQPIVVPDETDRHMAWYVHRGANADGGFAYLEIALLEPALAGCWWHSTEPPVAEIAVSVAQARQLTDAIEALLGSQATRPLVTAS